MVNFRRLIKDRLPRWVIIHKLKKSQSKRVLLTFDDGPDEKITPVVLDKLQEFNARAVFFVVGYKIDQHRNIVKRIVDEGHLLANHTYSHPHDRILNYSQYRHELQKTQDILSLYTTNKNTLFRPPCGKFDLVIFLAAKSLGLRIILWSNGSGEWSDRQSEDADCIAKSLKPTIKNGQIILLHDNNIKVPMILEDILPYLKDNKFDLENGIEELF